MEKDEKKLEKLKKDYKILKEKYILPAFGELNQDFWIEEIAETETDILIRKVRTKIGECLSNLLRLIESILNPVNAPMFIFSIIKLIEPDDKKKLSEIYKELMKKEIRIINLDFEFNEQKEAEFIKDSYESWQGIKKDMLKIIGKINKKWDDKSETNSKGYFG